MTDMYLSALAIEISLGGKLYNILWGAVFAFASLNILGLVALRFEPGRTRMTIGEMLAIAVAAVAVVMLGWELLFFFHVLPIRLQPR
jgi:hypothetical protein